MITINVNFDEKENPNCGYDCECAFHVGDDATVSNAIKPFVDALLVDGYQNVSIVKAFKDYVRDYEYYNGEVKLEDWND